MKIKKVIRELTAIVLMMCAAFCAHADADPAAAVTTNGVTTLYATLVEAWADARGAQDTNIDATVKLLKDATVDSPLLISYSEESSAVLTLDLNDHVLAYGGTGLFYIIDQNGGALNVIDTATTRTPRYFTRDETGLWTLTNEVTDLTVSGGLLTGGRAGAINNSYVAGDTCISNVNVVGNSCTGDGGAVMMTHDEVSCTITASTFLGNVSSRNGGAVIAGVCTMTDCRVEANVAAKKGGGVYVRRHGSLVRTEVVGNKAGTGGGVCVEKAASGCFPAGTKILMADGTEKNIESVADGDVVATFDHVGGTNSSAAVFYVYRGLESKRVFTLSFASGATLDIADRHDLVLETTRKYVTVSSDNARSYVGKRFYNYTTGGWDELIGVESAEDCEVYYSIYTRGHGNSVANGFLTVPDDKDCFINVYELDEHLKADAAQLAADIATYGLATPADYPNVPISDFEDGNNRYAFIAIGKGLTTQEELLFWFEYDYGPVVAKKEASTPRLTMTAARPKLMAARPLAAPSDPYLTLGEGVVITNNFAGTEATETSNVYLKHASSSNKTLIMLTENHDGICVGVEHSDGMGQFTKTDNVSPADVALFTSDNPEYAVRFDADGQFLKLGYAGIQVGDDAWALIRNGACTVRGTGDMWSYDKPGTSALWDYRRAITNVVIADAVTSVGTNAFAYLKGVKVVEVGGSVTNVCEDAFFSCLNVTNLVVGANVQTVGDSAFGRCNSLADLSFGSRAVAEACQGKAFKIVARITMDGKTPIIDAVPKVTITGYRRTLKGCETLDGEWVVIEDETKIPENYHFFKYEYVEEK